MPRLRTGAAIFALAVGVAAGGCQLISGADDFTFSGDITCESVNDCPGMDTTCAYRACDAKICALVAAPAGTPCTENDGTSCDGDGACVSVQCTNGVTDGDESAADCGGALCAPCDEGDTCNSFADCASKFCDPVSNTGGGGGEGGGGEGGEGGEGGGGEGGGGEGGSGEGGSGGMGGMGGSGGMGASGGMGGSGVGGSGMGGSGMGGSGGIGGPTGPGVCAPCTNDVDCQAAGDSYCDAGTCTPRKALGASCEGDVECTTGFCVTDGLQSLCCDSACDADCVSCRAAHTGGVDGTCEPVIVGTDPVGECPNEGAASCGIAGMGCNGDLVNPGCLFYDTSTQCVPQACDPTSNEQTTAGLCDGAGTCSAGTTTSCGFFLCNTLETACRATCTAHGDCTLDAYCTSNVCVSKEPDGDTCSIDEECQSGSCVDGRCCESACGGTCKRCNLAGSLGSCANIPNNQDPDGECLLSCNGNGGCQL